MISIFEADLDGWILLGRCAEAELRGDPTLVEGAKSEPELEDHAQTIEDRADRSVRGAHQIDVLGIAQRGWEVELVERRPAAEPEFGRQDGVGEDGHYGPGDDEILLNLVQFWPGRLSAPRREVQLRDHSSGSGARRTTIFHLGSRSRTGGAKSGRLASVGSSSTQVAFETAMMGASA